MPPRKQARITLAVNRQQTIVMGEVQDVYEPTKKAPAAVNVREHGLSYLHHMGSISLEQYLAGNEFRRHYEAANLGGFKGIDYSRIRVDGGVVAEPLTERTQRAFKWLSEAAQSPGIGKVGFSLLCRIAGDGETIKSVAGNWPGESSLSKQRMEGFIRMRLVESLDALIELTGIVARGADRRG